MKKKKIWIFDIDGTLADNGARQQFVRSKPKNWNAYKKNLMQDKLIDAVAQVVYSICDNGRHDDIFICSGRDESQREETEAWLEKHYIPFNKLMMRKDGDHRDDTIVKEEMLMELKQKYDIIAVFDDRVKVVNMWRKHGIFVFDCNQTREEF